MTTLKQMAEELRTANYAEVDAKRAALYAAIDKLEADSEWLSCLEAAGVDNWDGFDEARAIRDEQ